MDVTLANSAPKPFGFVLVILDVQGSEHNGKAASFVLSLSIWGMGFDIKLIMEYILTTCWAVVRVCSGFVEKGEEGKMSRWVGLRDSSVVPQGTASRGPGQWDLFSTYVF